MDVLVLGGFLGAGKTTLLSQLVSHYLKLHPSNGENTPVAILENEIGDIGVDDVMLSKQGYSVTSLLSGCACCTLASEIPYALKRIEENLQPSLVIIETTGVAVPWRLKETLEKSLDVKCIVAILVDAKRWKRIRIPLDHLLKRQLEKCDLVLINKINLIDDKGLGEVKASLTEYNTTAPVICVDVSTHIPNSVFSQLLGE